MQKRSSCCAHFQSRVRQSHKLDPAFPIKLSRWRMGQEFIRDLHAHDCLELGLCHSGAGLFLVDNRVFHFQAGSCVILAPNVFHRAQSKTPTSTWTFLFLDPVRLIANSTFHPDWTNLRGLGGAKFPYVVSPQMNSGLPGVLLEVIAELEKAGPHWQECVRGLVVALLARLQRLPGGTQTPPSRQAALLQRLAPALELMAGTVERSASIVESARACHMSLPSFRRNFRRALGCSPKRYQLQLRVHAAAARLDGEDRKIITLALECGFNSLSAFNRNFKALLGVSPQAWRMGRRKKQV